jgi:hypothetical protein
MIRATCHTADNVLCLGFDATQSIINLARTGALAGSS